MRVKQFVGVLLLASALPIHAQNTAHLTVRATVTQPSLRVTVTSALVDFGRLQADGGAVVLDPATGEVSKSGNGRHQLGVVTVTGAAGTAYAVAVAAPSLLRGDLTDLRFRLRWAESRTCGSAGFSLIPSASAHAGEIGPKGQSCLRVGGSLTLHNAPPGVYEGAVQMRFATL